MMAVLCSILETRLGTAHSLPPCGGRVGEGVRHRLVVCSLPPSLPPLPLKGGGDAGSASVAIASCIVKARTA